MQDIRMYIWHSNNYVKYNTNIYSVESQLMSE